MSDKRVMRNAHESVVLELRRMIAHGDLAPGERVREVEIANQLGVSRTPVREAFRSLIAEGLVTLQAGMGVMVSVYSPEDVHLIHEVGSLVEGRVARFATERISIQQVRALMASCDRLESLAIDDVRGCFDENARFHGTIFDIVGSARLTHVGRQLLEIPMGYKHHYWSDPELRAMSVQAHRAVCEAFEARDADAAEEAMRMHVSETDAFITAWMQEDAAGS